MTIPEKINEVLDQEQRPLKLTEILELINNNYPETITYNTLAVTLWRLVDDGRLMVMPYALRCPNFYYKESWENPDEMADFDLLAQKYVKKFTDAHNQEL